MSQSNLSFEELRAKCIKEGKLFEDPDFPATNKSISLSPVSSNISWKRPPEFCKEPQFIVNDATRFDLDQGSLGNCWFIAAAATLATRPDMLERVVPKKQSFTENYAGIFRFNFWRYGDWKEVVVDDRLPVKYGKTLEFCRNKEEPDEFWSALLEKAYAKLNGSYGALLGGNIQDALVDLTGGVSEIVNLDDKTQSNDDLYSMMEIFDAANSLMGSSISVLGKSDSAPHERGLLSGHAYCITGLKTITITGDKKIRLIRLLNPWGETEWTGPWSDSSNEWKTVPEDTKKKLQLKVLADGEFWMSFVDWRSTFTQLQLCHLTLSCFKHSTAHEVDWQEEAVHGAWVKGVNAGGCGCTPHEKSYWDNPQYCIVLRESDVSSTLQAPVVISLMQKEQRDLQIGSGGNNFVIGFRLFRITKNEPMTLNNAVYPRETVVIEKGLYEKFREVAHHYDNISAGTYCIIPTTYSPNEEASFFLRVLTRRKAELLDAMKIKDLKNNLSRVGMSRSMLGVRMAAVNLNSGRVEEINSPLETPVRVQSLGSAPTSEAPPPSTEWDGVDGDGLDGVDQSYPEEDLTPSGQDILEAYETLVGGQHRRSFPRVDFGLLRRILTRVNDIGQLGGYKLHFGEVECRILFHMVSSWRERRHLTFDQVRRIVLIVKQWVRMFSLHDRDFTEFISFGELWIALSSLGFELDDGVKESITVAYAANSEGLFVSDFVSCVAKIQATTAFWKTKTHAEACNISLQELLERVMLT